MRTALVNTHVIRPPSVETGGFFGQIGVVTPQAILTLVLSMDPGALPKSIGFKCQVWALESCPELVDMVGMLKKARVFFKCGYHYSGSNKVHIIYYIYIYRYVSN